MTRDARGGFGFFGCRRRRRRRRATLLAAPLLAAIAWAAAAPSARATGALLHPDTQYEPMAWTDLPGWAEDDHAAAFATFLASCEAVLRGRAESRDPRPVFTALRSTCRDAVRAGPQQAAGARAFFESHFTPLRIARLGEPAGFLTGYYEPIVDGSRFPNPEFHTPVYRRPRDLVPAVPSAPGQSLSNKGEVKRRTGAGELVPYHDRAAIEQGALDGQGLEICYLRDPADLFFIQIQGSGRIRLEDGTLLRINYDAHNGWPYTPVGRVLIEKGIIPREQMSMDAIRKWMAAAPEAEVAEVRRANASFVFFRVVGLSGDREAVGAQGIPLTAWRSIAVDRHLHVYGTPFFIFGDLPIEGESAATPFNRLMIGQDTGSAIIGPARADIYFGAGDDAGRIAGRLRHPAAFAMLAPRALDPAAAARHLPLPPARPALAWADEDLPAMDPPLPRPRPTPAAASADARP